MSQPRTVSTVHLVVDPQFGERIATLPLAGALWAVESGQNTPVVERLARASTLNDGLRFSTFAHTAETPEDDAIAVLETIEDHYAGYGDEPYSVLQIIGCTASDRLAASLRLSGFAVESSDSHTVRAVRTSTI